MNDVPANHEGNVVKARQVWPELHVEADLAQTVQPAFLG